MVPGAGIQLRYLTERAIPYDWADALDTSFAARLQDRNLAALANRSTIGTLLEQAHPKADYSRQAPVSLYCAS